MTDFRRFLVGSLLLWSVFSFSLAQEAMAQALPLGGASYPGVDITKYLGDSTGAQGIVDVLKNLFSTIKKILAPILVFLIAGFGIRLIVAGGEEEAFNKASKHFLYLLIGTAFVVLANFLTETFSLYQTGTGGTTTFVSGPDQILSTTQKIKDQLGLVIAFLRYLLGGIAVFYVVRSGSAMIINADEETANKQKEVFYLRIRGISAHYDFRGVGADCI